MCLYTVESELRGLAEEIFGGDSEAGSRVWRIGFLNVGIMTEGKFSGTV